MVPRNSEIHSSQHAGRARKSCGAPSTSSKPCSIGAISSPMRPMSWYSGSHDTARSACVSPRAGDDGVDVRPDAAVGEHHALRRRGRPARELQDGEAVGIVGPGAVHAAAPACAPSAASSSSSTTSRVLGRRIEERCEVAVDHDERGVGVGDATSGLLDELLDRPEAHREGERDDACRRPGRSAWMVVTRWRDVGPRMPTCTPGPTPRAWSAAAMPRASSCRRAHSTRSAGPASPAAEPTKVMVPGPSAAVWRRETTEGIGRWTPDPRRRVTRR